MFFALNAHALVLWRRDADRVVGDFCHHVSLSQHYCTDNMSGFIFIGCAEGVRAPACRYKIDIHQNRSNIIVPAPRVTRNVCSNKRNNNTIFQ